MLLFIYFLTHRFSEANHGFSSQQSGYWRRGSGVSLHLAVRSKGVSLRHGYLFRLKLWASQGVDQITNSRTGCRIRKRSVRVCGYVQSPARGPSNPSGIVLFFLRKIKNGCHINCFQWSQEEKIENHWQTGNGLIIS
jgi:hypothetical protein